MLLTCLARELRRRGERNIWVASEYTDVFIGNQDVGYVTPEILNGTNWWIRKTGARFVSSSYAPHIEGERRDAPPGKHILAMMCEQVGIRGSVQLRPYLTLSDLEKNGGQHAEHQVAIQSSGRSARQFMWTKEWFPERFQDIVSQLKSQVKFIQLGHVSDPLIEGALDLRGKTTIRESAAVLANSMLFVGLVGFLMHLARAVDCPSVIIYGGRELPEQTGYICNENITNRLPCSPCWRYDNCPGGRSCMEMIKSDQVIEAILKRLVKPSQPLAVQEIIL